MLKCLGVILVEKSILCNECVHATLKDDILLTTIARWSCETGNFIINI